MSRIWILLLLLVLAAPAVNTLEQSFTCPICGHVWTQRIETSSRPTGLRLDLRQLGDVVDPPTLPQCPNCRFVVFSESLKPATIDRLKPFVQGQDYQMFAAKSPTYFCLAQLQELLRAPAKYIAQSYLRAAWQSEDKPAVAARYLAMSEQLLAKALDGMIPEEKAYPDAALLRGEILRRLARWDEADQSFRTLGSRPDFQEPKRQQLVAQELSLIERKDSQPQQLREPGAAGQDPEMLPDPVPISVRKPKIGEPK